MWNRLNLRSRLILIFIGIALLSSTVLMLIGQRVGTDSITEQVNDRLIAVRNAKAYELESYFDNLGHVVETLAEQESVGSAVVEMRAAFRAITEADTIDCQADLSEYYEGFIDRLSQQLRVRREIEAFYPRSVTACYLQYHYLATNGDGTTDRAELDRAPGDRSTYAALHQRYHPGLRENMRRYGFYDLFLIDAETYDILYTVYKETDFATNLRNGPYRNSNLAALIDKVRRNSDLAEAQVVDFAFYRPSYGHPAAFIGAPIYHQGEFVGVLAAQLPIDQINELMTYGQRWSDNGLGETGEVLLLGNDYLLRSDSRLYFEDSSSYYRILDNESLDEDAMDRLHRMGPILTVPLRGDNVELAADGREGLMQVAGYLGEEVLSAYMPLDLPDGLDWSLIAEIHVDEALKSVTYFQRLNFAALALIIVLTTILAMVITRSLIRPIDQLTAAAEAVGAGDTSIRVSKTADDELGRLTEVFNDMVVSIDEQKQEIKNRTDENDALLFSRFPPAIAERFKNGEDNIVDRFERVAVICCDLRGTDQLRDLTNEEAWSVVQQYSEAFAEVAREVGLEVIVPVPDGYLAVCGMNTPRLDNGRRIAIAAMGLRDAVRAVNRRNGIDLQFSIGIAHGHLLAGVLQGETNEYVVWGSTLDQAQRLAGTGTGNSIRGTMPLIRLLEGNFAFDGIAPIFVDPVTTFRAGFLLGRVADLKRSRNV